MTIAIASDHAGYQDLKWLNEFVESLGYNYKNFGPFSYDPEDDYPDFIIPAAQSVADKESGAAIILGGSGQGEAIAANRIRGVRAAVFYGPVLAKTTIDISGLESTDPYEIVRLSRQHNNANVLSLASRFLSKKEMKTAIKIWLETPFSDAPRHQRRITKLDESI